MFICSPVEVNKEMFKSPQSDNWRSESAAVFGKKYRISSNFNYFPSSTLFRSGIMLRMFWRRLAEIN